MLPYEAMSRQQTQGLFVTGTDTNVGKTFVACMIARDLVAQGRRVGVYKPAASGCRRDGRALVSEDALALWQAAGRPGSLEEVCPQCFEAPLAPHLAAKLEGRQLDRDKLRQGFDVWRASSDFVLVEGAGGLMSPLGEGEYVADLAHELRLPLLVVAHNRLGVINQVMQTLVAAETYRGGQPVAGYVLNQPAPPADTSIETNATELRRRTSVPLLAELYFGADHFPAPVDWYEPGRAITRRS